MIITTDKNILEQYTVPYRIWQGIPSIAVTEKGRIFITYYSGGIKEDIGNYIIVDVSDDDGKTFKSPVTIVYPKDGRCFDPEVWIDTKKRLWLFWSKMAEKGEGLYASVCENPDADEIVWSEPKLVGYDIMMCKPCVLSTGEWILPIAVWTDKQRNGCFPQIPNEERKNKQTGAYAYKSVDNGETFIQLGSTCAPKRSFDEHMIVELSDKLMMLIRTEYGIAVSYSYDRGNTWTDAVDSKLGGPCSRFSITKLSSGRFLLINHYDFKGRNNLYAMLSDDDCKTFKYKLLLDGRNWVSYPDVQEKDGFIYITYDRERGGFKKTLQEAYADAREILLAKITEEDIIAGKLINKQSKLAQIVNKLGKYAKEDENPHKELNRFTDLQLATFLLEKFPDKIAEKIFEYYPINCVNMQKLASRFDVLVERLEKEENKLPTVLEMVTIVRSVDEETSAPIVELVKKVIESEQADSVSEIAEKVGVSRFYLQHVFKKTTGTTITEYKNSMRLTKAKLLLVTTDESITDIALKCGFETSSYFAEVFKASEKISPTQYRELLKK